MLILRGAGAGDKSSSQRLRQPQRPAVAWPPVPRNHLFLCFRGVDLRNLLILDWLDRTPQYHGIYAFCVSVKLFGETH
jgi:hypothetical protein